MDCLPGIARLKSEYVLEDGKVDDGVPNKPEKKRGMDRQRRSKMSKARVEMRKNTLRLCSSLLTEEGESSTTTCKYGDKCTAEHSRQNYWAKKASDLGPNCPLFDQMGKCPFSLACCFARAHTDPKDLSQIKKEPNAHWKPTINNQTLQLQIKLRKRLYEFHRAENALKKLAVSTTPSVGCMEREKPRLEMSKLRGKTFLAPLTTVGNLPFRRLCVELGAEVTCGEMAMATQILKGIPSELSLLKRHPSEKLFGVQLAGGYADSLARTSELIKDNFDVDFIDLNLGCPLDFVNDKGGGCSLGARANKLADVLSCMQLAASDLPVSIKMRYGMKEGRRTAHATIKAVAERCPPQLLTLHPRSREQRYTKAAEWDYVDECARAIDGRFPFFACGDILSFEDYNHYISNKPIDGIMIGRGALIKPWIFTEIAEQRSWDISSSERFDLIKKFVFYGLEHWGSDCTGVENTRRFLLEWLSFQHRYIPLGILQEPPQRINQRPPSYRGRDELETLLSSASCLDWIKISEMLLGKTPGGFVFAPKHNANAY